jgi:hypothetical protein
MHGVIIDKYSINFKTMDHKILKMKYLLFNNFVKKILENIVHFIFLPF